MYEQLSKGMIDLFVLVAERGSFNKAAQEAFVSPTAVMKQMNALENIVGTPLLERGRRGIRLTAAGSSFLSDAQAISADIERAVTTAREKGDADRPVRVGLSPQCPCDWLLDLMRKGPQHFDEFHIELVPFSDAMWSLTDEGVPFDLVLTVGGDAPPNKPNERYIELFPVPVCMAVPRSHRLFGRTTLTVDDLRGESLVIAQPGVSWRADQVRRSLSDPALDLHLVERPYTFSAFNRCAREGMLMLSTDMWRNIHPDLHNIPVEWSHSFSYGVFLPRRGDELIERFLELLVSAAAER